MALASSSAMMRIAAISCSSVVPFIALVQRGERLRSPLASKTTARHRVSLVGGQSRRRFDYHTVAPDAIEKTMPPVASDLLETKLPQQGAARAVLGKHPADQLMQPRRGARLDECCQHRSAGAAAAVSPGDIHREFGDRSSRIGRCKE